MSDQWEGGKGDQRRLENRKRFEAGYEAIFNPDPKEREKWRRRWYRLTRKDSNASD